MNAVYHVAPAELAAVFGECPEMAMGGELLSPFGRSPCVNQLSSDAIQNQRYSDRASKDCCAWIPTLSGPAGI